MVFKSACCLLLAALPICAQRAESASTVSLSTNDGQQTLEITNVTYQVTGDYVPGRPQGQRLLLRETVASKEVLGDIGVDATTMLEAWPLGLDPKQTPLYSLKVSGVGGETVDNTLFVADRGLEEVSWWSVYRLGTGQHLFDTYVPLVSFSISTDVEEQRYVGLEVPPDNVADARLKRPNVVAVLTYASEERIKREALITCDDPDNAALLRSYADTTRTISVAEGKPPRSLKVSFQPNVSLTVPLAGDDLDLTHAQMPACLHLVAWKR